MDLPEERDETRQIHDPNRAEIEAAITSLVSLTGQREDEAARDLAREMITTVVRFMRDRAPLADLKMLTRAIKEFRYADLVFRPYTGIRKVCIFGSARTQEGDGNYMRAREFASEMAKRGWMVVTGGGPGIMAAANEGAGAERSFGLRIHLPFEPGSNPTLARDPKLINFRYFFTRKVFFMKESHAFILLPGGFGTLDEAFELLTLMQTGRSDIHPIVLLESPDGTYWQRWQEFLIEELIPRGLISHHDLSLFKVASDIGDAVAEIEHFYSNYHSERYVNKQLIIRLHIPPSEEVLAELSREFADILSDGEIVSTQPSAAEIDENDFLELGRIALWFDRASFSRLRMLIDRLNEGH